jgi:polyisoprenoid-binding protein YceI
MKAVLALAVLFSVSSLSLGSVQAAVEAPSVKLEKSVVEFKATGRPSALKIVGKGEGLNGNLAFKGASLAGQITFDMNALTTGIAMRDEHMKKKYLEVEKYPQAKLTITELKLPDAAGKGADFAVDDVGFNGTLALHGVEKPIQGKAKVTRAGGDGTALASFAIKISDYAIAVPSFAGITVADDVEIKVETNGVFQGKAAK